MDFKQVSQKAIEIRAKYAVLEIQRYGKRWTKEQIAEGFVGDVGDLMKLVLAKSGVRKIAATDQKLSHELADCLWSVLVLADQYGVDLEKEFMTTMDEIEESISRETI